MNIFKRYTPGIEARSVDGAVEGSLPPITGMAALYYDPKDMQGTQYQLAPGIVERISSGVFDAVMGSDAEIMALQDHDQGLFLGRRSSGTLKISLSERGLGYWIDTPATQVGHDTLSLIQRRDITGASIAMWRPVGTWSFEMDGVQKRYVRTVTSLETILDLGPVLQPAYPGTSAEIGFRSCGITVSRRSGGQPPEELKAIETELQTFIQSNWNQSEAAYRLRQLEFRTVDARS